MVNEFDPFSMAHSDAIWDSEPYFNSYKGDPVGGPVEYSMEKSYRQLGGFVFSLAIDQSSQSFIDEVEYYMT